MVFTPSSVQLLSQAEAQQPGGADGMRDDLFIFTSGKVEFHKTAFHSHRFNPVRSNGGVVTVGEPGPQTLLKVCQAVAPQHVFTCEAEI